jgi:hypothetical protein
MPLAFPAAKRNTCIISLTLGNVKVLKLFALSLQILRPAKTREPKGPGGPLRTTFEHLLVCPYCGNADMNYSSVQEGRNTDKLYKFN